MLFSYERASAMEYAILICAYRLCIAVRVTIILRIPRESLTHILLRTLPILAATRKMS